MSDPMLGGLPAEEYGRGLAERFTTLARIAPGVRTADLSTQALAGISANEAAAQALARQSRGLADS